MHSTNPVFCLILANPQGLQCKCRLLIGICLLIPLLFHLQDMDLSRLNKIRKHLHQVNGEKELILHLASAVQKCKLRLAPDNLIKAIVAHLLLPELLHWMQPAAKLGKPTKAKTKVIKQHQEAPCTESHLKQQKHPRTSNSGTLLLLEHRNHLKELIIPKLQLNLLNMAVRQNNSWWKASVKLITRCSTSWKEFASLVLKWLN